MVPVYKVSSSTFEATRLHLPQTAWAEDVLASLDRLGFKIEPTDEGWFPDNRDEAELARRDAILDLTEE